MNNSELSPKLGKAIAMLLASKKMTLSFYKEQCRPLLDEIISSTAVHQLELLEAFIDYGEFADLFGQLSRAFGIASWTPLPRHSLEQEKQLALHVENTHKAAIASDKAEPSGVSELVALALAHLRSRLYRYTNRPGISCCLLPSLGKITSLVETWLACTKEAIAANEKKNDDDDNDGVDQAALDNFVTYLTVSAQIDELVCRLDELASCLEDDTVRDRVANRLVGLRSVYGRLCWFVTDEDEWVAVRARYAKEDGMFGHMIAESYFVHSTE